MLKTNKKAILSLFYKTFRRFCLLVSIFYLCESRSEYIIHNKKIDSKWLPITYVINGTFDVSQNQYWFNQNDFFSKNKTLWKRVSNPVANIDRDGGFKEFVKSEFLSDRVIPNILLHTVGGAYDGLWLTEYYTQHEFPYPRFLANLTSYLARWGNEILEVSSEEINSHDHIADLLFFDSVGLLMSSNKKVMNFLVEDLQMKGWHSIPFYDFKEDNIHNAGLNYIIRPRVLNVGMFSPLFYFGMQNIIGLSYKTGENTFSFGAGVFLTDPIRRKSRFVSSFFYETSGNLGLSAFINGSEGFKWRVNLYPNLNRILKSYNVGILIGERWNEDEYDLNLGVNINLPIGLGNF